MTDEQMTDETAEFPLPADATDDERATARGEIGKRTRIVAEERGAVRFIGRWMGQTGPIWHFQYLRMYQLPKGYLIVGHDLREGIRVGYADELAELPRAFDHPAVEEFIEDELRFRGALADEHATSG